MLPKEDAMDLDTMLDEATPRLAERTPELDSLLADMIEAGRTKSGSRRLRRLGLACGSLGLAGVVGIGGVAAAGAGPELVQDLFPWTTDDGTTCSLVSSFEPREPTDPNYSPSQSAALISAEQWLAAFDLDSIDVVAAEERFVEHLVDVSAGSHTRADIEESFDGDRLETHALSHAASTQLDQHLRAQGFDPQALNGSVAVLCGER